MLHSGHVAFLKQAASLGNLYVCIGSDKTVAELKGRYPVTTQDERKYMIEALKCVHECRINTGSGIIDFENELHDIKPDYFVVNEDGHTPYKEKLCESLNIEYKVLKRIPDADLPVRSTTALRTASTIPFRIDLAGGWLDQPFVSKFYPGPVLTISIEPIIEFNNRSGMASSTRNKAIELWNSKLPEGNREQLAHILFSYENPPDTRDIAGSQDALGIVMPGLNYLYYDNNYWPSKIESVLTEDILCWLEERLYLVTLGPRGNDYAVLDNTMINENGAKLLADAANNCWDAILKKDTEAFGKYFTDSFNAQVKMFPNMADDTIYELINVYREMVKGYKLSGAGGGGYLILVSDEPVKDAISIKIRRKDWL